MWWFSEAKGDVQWWLDQTTPPDHQKRKSASKVRRREKAASSPSLGVGQRGFLRERTSPTNAIFSREIASTRSSNTKVHRKDKNCKVAEKSPIPPKHSNGLEGHAPSLGVWDSEGDDHEHVCPDPLFFAIARFTFCATQDDELSLQEGQLIAVLETSPDGWWLGKEGDKAKCRAPIREGWFPASYVHAIREEPIAQASQQTNLPGDSQVPVALVAPYMSLVGPLEPTGTSTDIQQLPTVDRLNMNFYRNLASDRPYDPVANSSWPRAGLRMNSLVAKLEPVIETVVARFAFQARGAEELSFGKGERLDILERPEDDPDWLLAANCLGQKGLVPINHLRDIDASAGSTDLQLLGRRTSATGGDGWADVAAEYEHQPWFFGAVSRAYADVSQRRRR
ncbi:hypothetical protein BIW11_13817 [Tropilaelaps mercedesae]|uniref:SH3 domain-containing protein n=1 Tax=Tropilaelaps mercedesae TaxID=418985 RepID=A0A1V9X0V6_9ACAR|nr:hypothetical protein BIW11_13817 [Tropilaelaps mercedesae]